MGFLTLKLKTLGIAAAGFLLSWVALGLLFNLPFLHGFYETVESFIYYQLFTSTAEPSTHLVIIDEEETEYDRRTYAELIAGLDRLGTKAIAMDVLFAGAKDSAQDAALVAATQSASDKIIHAVEFIDRDNHAIIPDRFHLNVPDKPSAEQSIEGVYGAQMPFGALLEVTKNLGHITQAADITRRAQEYFPLLIHYNDRLYPALPLLAVMKFLGCPADTLSQLPDEVITLSNGATKLEIPVDHKMQTLINFIAPERFSGKIFSVTEALAHIQANQTIFKDKIVLIGNSLNPQEQTHGPHFRSYPNLFIHGALISQMLNGQTIREGTFENFYYSFALVLLGLIWMFFASNKSGRFRPWQIYVFAFLSLLAMAAIGISLGVKTLVLLPYAMFCIVYAVSQYYYSKAQHAALGSGKRINYLDYYLLIGPKKEKDGAYPIFLVDSPAGEDSGELKFPLPETEMAKVREAMQNFSLEVTRLKDFGANLFEALFQPDIRDHYDKSLGMAYAKNACLRIKLRIDAPDLACYPWEYMYDGKQTQEFLALHQTLSVTRFVAIPEPVPAVSLKPPLRILVVVPNPLDGRYPPLNVEAEKKLIKAALGKLERRGIVQLQFLKEATLNGLAKELKKRVDIIHFIGHGAYAEPLGGGLVFENKAGEADLVNIDRLGKLLEGKPLRLVVLNACQTAQTSASDIAMGVAQGLVKIGVPAVVAMQLKIPDESAIEFSKEFYATLAETFQVDRAVSEARRKMFINLEAGRIDWGIPVLFMRKDDGLFLICKLKSPGFPLQGMSRLFIVRQVAATKPVNRELTLITAKKN
ncbi:MAG: CHAT domain-containing protein [bacterium]